MSLKHFHVVFIAASLGLALFMGYWARQMAGEGLPQPAAAAFAVAGASGGLLYLRWFLRKYRTLS